jgi:L-iditol 2-dehydrogenase
MKAAVYHAPDDLRYEELPEPTAGPGEVVVRMTRCGLCGTDLAKIRLAKVPPGTVLGHEIVGEVVEVGAGVGGLAAGDRVVVAHHVPCLACVFCRHENYSLCPAFKATNVEPGGFAERLRVLPASVERGVFRVPDEMTDEEALFAEPVACCIRGMRRAGIQPGDAVAILGCGPIGLTHVQLSRRFGAGRVIGVDPIASRARRAEALGADAGIAADGLDPVRAVREATGGLGPDVVLNTVGRPEAYEQAFAMVRPGGHVVFFAQCPPGSRLALDPDVFARNEVTVVGSYSPGPDDLPRALEMIRQRQVEVASLISHRIPLARLAEAVCLAGSAIASLKIVLVP